MKQEIFERYQRQVALEGVGQPGQESIFSSRVLVVGAGGLGSPALLYLAASGVGCIGIVDDDRVEVSNLPRQLIYGEKDLGRPKAEAAAEKLRAVNGRVKVETFSERFCAGSAGRILERFGFVLDCTDNFPTKFLVNDACVSREIPFCHGGVLGWKGQALTWVPGSLCYRCIFREEPGPGTVPDCRQEGVLGMVPGVVGTIQALEALRYFLGMECRLVNRIMTFDAREMDFRFIPVGKTIPCDFCRDIS